MVNQYSLKETTNLNKNSMDKVCSDNSRNDETKLFDLVWLVEFGITKNKTKTFFFHRIGFQLNVFLVVWAFINNDMQSRTVIENLKIQACCLLACRVQPPSIIIKCLEICFCLYNIIDDCVSDRVHHIE